MVTFAALAHVWVHLQMLAVGYDISRETKWRHDLGEQNQRLTLELRTRMDLASIERAARERAARWCRPIRAPIRVVQAVTAHGERRRAETYAPSRWVQGAALLLGGR